MKKEHFFYYDEAFHDRKITIKNGIPNNYMENSSDIFVGVFWGCEESLNSGFLNRFRKFESKYKTKLGLIDGQELKGTTIKKSNFTKGIASFNSNAVEFYNDFFDIFSSDIILHMSLLSKSSEMLRIVLENINFPNKIFKKDALIYSIIKFLDNYRCYDIFECFFDTSNEIETEAILDIIIKRLKSIANRTYDVKRKKIENNVFYEMIERLILARGELRIESKYKWNYNNIFLGFNDLLEEVKIESKNIVVFIDEEENTVKAAIEINSYKEVIPKKSEVSLGVRVSDIFSNFIGRIINAIIIDMVEDSIRSESDLSSYDFETKKLLSSDWFDLTEDQFDLIIKIRNIFEIRGKYHWTAKTSIYFDKAYLFFLYLHYFNNFKNYESYQEKKSELHSEFFNTFSCKALYNKYISYGW